MNFLKYFWCFRWSFFFLRESSSTDLHLSRRNSKWGFLIIKKSWSLLRHATHTLCKEESTCGECRCFHWSFNFIWDFLTGGMCFLYHAWFWGINYHHPSLYSVPRGKHPLPLFTLSPVDIFPLKNIFSVIWKNWGEYWNSRGTDGLLSIVSLPVRMADLFPLSPHLWSIGSGCLETRVRGNLRAWPV